MKLAVISVLALAISGCHYHHGHHTHSTAKAVVHTAAHLDAQHQHTNIIVVKKPAKRKKCWKHAGHWHCNR
ncbi:hypothetical protein [Kangiella sp. TOML190]|uniref:hypothetical protein n=1 Tax=Kangiella sp. TOML190 TaxID=2931351 RepID=UPI00203F2991|nr:hypothetical protein [Kangiella sp. TOML190]